MNKKRISIRKELLHNINREQKKRASIQATGLRDKEPNLLHISNSLDEFYFLEKLKVYCGYLSYRLMVNDVVIGYQVSSLRLMEEILAIMEREIIWHPALLIYYQLCQLFEAAVKGDNHPKPVLTIFEAIEENILQCKEEFSDGELIELYSYLTNYATYQMNNGNDLFLIKNITHSQNQINLHQGNNQDFLINTGTYRNMLVLILRTKDLQDKTLIRSLVQHKYQDSLAWAHHFVEFYKKNLPEISRDKYYNYGKAMIYFQAGEFQKAFALIKNLDRVRELFINFDIKILRLQLLMELEIEDDRILEQEQLKIEDEIEKLRSMLKYDKISNPKLAYQRDYYWEFLDLYRKFYSFFKKFAWMFRFGDQSYHEMRNKLKQEISDSRPSFKIWFLDKLEAIK